MNSEKNGRSNVIVLDDDEDTRFAIKRILGKCGCAVFEAESVEEALAITETHKVDVIFSDMRIPGEDGGEELLEQVQEENLDVQVVLMSCAMDAEMTALLMSKGAANCVQKPFFTETCQEILAELTEPLRKSA